jgi:hypothetical protein
MGKYKQWHNLAEKLYPFVGSTREGAREIAKRGYSVTYVALSTFWRKNEFPQSRIGRPSFQEKNPEYIPYTVASYYTSEGRSIVASHQLSEMGIRLSHQTLWNYWRDIGIEKKESLLQDQYVVFIDRMHATLKCLEAYNALRCKTKNNTSKTNIFLLDPGIRSKKISKSNTVLSRSQESPEQELEICLEDKITQANNALRDSLQTNSNGHYVRWFSDLSH